MIEKQGTVLGTPGNWGDHEERHNEYDSWTLQLGLDKDIGDNWQMQARIQRGSTDRFTKVLNEIRVDREMLAIDAVEVVRRPQRDANGDGIVDLDRRSRRSRHGHDHLQRAALQPDAGSAAGIGRGRPRAGGAGRRFARQRRPDGPRADPVTGRSRRDPELRADEHFRHTAT